YRQIMLAYERIVAIPGISCVKPKGALYIFPKIDLSQFTIKDDNEFVYDLLVEQKVLVVAGQGFKISTPDHFRIVCLPNIDEMTLALNRIESFLESRRK
ncbi:MAG TPA: aminotransferase class I/II-fold pyridoxal phosphate-dependent enzyme, partial [Fibrella sp.]